MYWWCETTSRRWFCMIYCMFEKHVSKLVMVIYVPRKAEKAWNR